MVAFYKHDIPHWRGGTASLSDRAYRVYHVIVEEIMMQEGSFPLHERSLAGMANRSVRDCKLALNELVACGKIKIEGGRIFNERAEKELDWIRENRKNAAAGGKKTAEKVSTTPRDDLDWSATTPREAVENIGRHNEISSAVEAALDAANKPKREEKRREEKKESFPPALSLIPATAEPPATESAVVELKKGIVQAFIRAGSMNTNPDTHQASLWISLKYHPSVCLAVIEGILAKNPNVRSLSYFDSAIQQAHEKLIPDLPPEKPMEPKFDLGCGVVMPASLIAIHVANFTKTGHWLGMLGPPPGEHGCRIPSQFLPKKEQAA
jgi:uncharacterized protein YdaU (DUF1376 family)